MINLIIRISIGFFSLAGQFCLANESQALNLKDKATDGLLSLSGLSPERFVFITGIIRIYEKSLIESPNDVALRQRFIEFLNDNKQSKRSLFEMKVLSQLTPEDQSLKKRIKMLEAALSGQGAKAELGKKK